MANDEEVRVSPKLDGVYAKATAAGVFSKSGKPLNMPRIAAGLKGHFAKYPKSELQGELYRRGVGIEKIAGAARAGGTAAAKLNLHVFPDQGPRPAAGGAVRRVHAKTAKTQAEVDALFDKALALGHEGVMIRHADGRLEKRKPKLDAEYRAVSGSVGPRGVMKLAHPNGATFKAQGREGLVAKAGDQVQVQYSGTTARGIPKSAVAQRVRNNHDFSIMQTNDQSEQVKKDRRTLLKGSLLAAGGLGALALLAYKSRGGVVGQAPWVAPVKAEKAAVGAAGARANSVRKYSVEGATERGAKADVLKRKRAWSAMPTKAKGWGKRLAKQKPEVQAQAAALFKAGSRGAVVPTPQVPKNAIGQVSAQEAAATPRYERQHRQEARGQLQKLRETKGFDTPARSMIEFETKKRDKLAVGRDAAVLAAGLGVLGASGYAGYRAHGLYKMGKKLLPKQIPKLTKSSQDVMDAVKGASHRVTDSADNVVNSTAIYSDAGKIYKGVKGGLYNVLHPVNTAREIKAGFKAGLRGEATYKTAPRPAWALCTPAGRLFDFAGAQQLKDPETRAYASPLRVSSGMQRGYYDVDKGGTPLVKPVPVLHGQVIRAAMNKGHAINQAVQRGGGLTKDVADTVMGKERARDSAGRIKKKEWEKSWFKNKVGQVVTGAALLGGSAYLAKSPSGRAAFHKGEKWIARQARRVVPDAFPDDRVFLEEKQKAESGKLKHFSTPAGGMLGKLRQTAAGMVSPETPLGRFRGVSKALAASGDKAAIKLAKRRQKDAIRGLKKGAAIAGGGAAVGAGAMKLYADRPEGEKVTMGTRLRNAAVAAAAGSFLGGTVHAGASGFRGARVGGVLGGLAGLLSNPKRKMAIEDLPTASFATPAAGLFHFDEVAEDAGWDVRDPRGRSARVFAPGAGKRERRQKEWYEKTENERKLWQGAVIAAGVAGLAGGHALTKKLGKLKAAAVIHPPTAAAPVLGGIGPGPRMSGGMRPPRPAKGTRWQ